MAQSRIFGIALLGICLGAAGQHLLEKQQQPSSKTQEITVEPTEKRVPADLSQKVRQDKKRSPTPKDKLAPPKENLERNSLAELVTQDPLRYKDKVEATLEFEGDRLSYWERSSLFESYASSYLWHHADVRKTHEAFKNELGWAADYFKDNPDVIPFEERKDYIRTIVEMLHTSIILLKDRSEPIEELYHLIMARDIFKLIVSTGSHCSSSIGMAGFGIYLATKEVKIGDLEPEEHPCENAEAIELKIPIEYWDGFSGPSPDY